MINSILNNLSNLQFIINGPVAGPVTVLTALFAAIVIIVLHFNDAFPFKWKRRAV